MGVKFPNAPFLSDEEEARIQAGITADPDNPELTDEEISRLRPAREVLSHELFAAIKTAALDRPGLDNAKEAVTLRLDPETLARFKARGSDWRQQMAKVLEEAAI